MKTTIEIIVSPKGACRIETNGITGDGCREASKFIEMTLGKIVSVKLKPEFHEPSSVQNSVENSN